MTIRLPPQHERVTSLHFSNSGEYILVGMANGPHLIYDGFDTNSRLLFVLHGPQDSSPTNQLTNSSTTTPVNSSAVSSSASDVSPTALSHAGNGTEPSGPPPPQALVEGQDVTWTPDGQFVLSGRASPACAGPLCVWEVPPPQATHVPSGPTDLYPLAELPWPEGGSSAHPGVVEFNPRRAMLVSAAREVCFWLPAREVWEVGASGEAQGGQAQDVPGA